MPALVRYTTLPKSIIWIFLILFGLSPCIVKGAFLGILEIESTKTLNKSRAVAPVPACQVEQVNFLTVSIESEAESVNKTEPDFKPEISKASFRPILVIEKYSRNFSCNSPPRYILFKRLKIAVA